MIGASLAPTLETFTPAVIDEMTEPKLSHDFPEFLDFSSELEIFAK